MDVDEFFYDVLMASNPRWVESMTLAGVVEEPAEGEERMPVKQDEEAAMNQSSSERPCGQSGKEEGRQSEIDCLKKQVAELTEKVNLLLGQAND